MDELNQIMVAALLAAENKVVHSANITRSFQPLWVAVKLYKTEHGMLTETEETEDSDEDNDDLDDAAHEDDEDDGNDDNNIDQDYL